VSADSPFRKKIRLLAETGLLRDLSADVSLERGCALLARLAYDAEELGIFLSVIATAGLALPILAHGGEPMRALVDAAVTGHAILAVAITERDAGSDVLAMKTRLVRGNDGSLRLDGSKWHITNAPEADAVIVFAMNHTTSDRFLTAVVVKTDDPGVTLGPPLDLVGCHGSPTGEITFDHVVVPPHRIVGSAEEGQKLLELAFIRERLLAPFPMLGKMERVIEECLDYVEKRKQFGQALHAFQFVQDKILTAYSAMLHARHLAEQALVAARSDGPVSAFASLAKAQAADAAVEVFRAAIEIHGSYGLQTEARYGAYLADALCAQVAGGTRETHKKIVFGELRIDRARSRRTGDSRLFRYSKKGGPGHGN
jgi:alkylation response protein AidB-like acyl-CoA dehydrogenase